MKLFEFKHLFTNQFLFLGIYHGFISSIIEIGQVGQVNVIYVITSDMYNTYRTRTRPPTTTFREVKRTGNIYKYMELGPGRLDLGNNIIFSEEIWENKQTLLNLI